MTTFSEESLLLVKHWETVEDIFRAEKRLKGELGSILLSVEPQLSQSTWWQDGWKFVPHGQDQVYVSNERWLKDNEYGVWIGIEGFAPEKVFGTESPPNLYVWVAHGRHDLAQVLAEKIEVNDYADLGDVDHSRNGYVVKWQAMKCISEEVKDYEAAARKQIVDFISHYAVVLLNFDEDIKKHLAESIA